MRRADIEGLRAVAILAVLAFHAGVPHLAGGFVGVDVFFVISGFLITQQLLRPLREGGRLSLRDFYARRARRILPAAGVVLLVVLLVVLGWLILSPLRQVDLAHDALASALYVPNWWFISGQIDYSRAGLAVSPLLHYWSLGVEEQFYLVWPGLLLASAAIARRRCLALPGVVVAVLGVVITVSFVLSMVLAGSNQPLAFLGSPTRAWQFGVGALLAVWLPSSPTASVAPRLGPGLRQGQDQATLGDGANGLGRIRIPVLPAWIGWIGLAAIAGAIVVFDGLTPYPGVAALLPTLGTAAVISAGGGHGGGFTRRWLSPARWLASAPMRLIGPARRGHVVLLGDSHAVEWFSGVQQVAGARGWDVEMLAKGGCPLPAFMTVPAQLGRPYTECATWRENVMGRLATQPKPAVIFVSTLNHYLSDQSVVMAGWRVSLARLARLGVPIVYLRDNPYPGTDVPDCISGAASDWAHCAFPRASGLPEDPLAAAITAGTVTGVRMVDLTGLLCPPGPRPASPCSGTRCSTRTSLI